ncbi:MAG: 50S ribosomal protein L21 [Deltaproteobacteria bacterium]|nr:50S ribosomal protein L21 [Deltaproteobacteria bacterium]
MYAVIQTGGKQYKVAEGDKVVVEKLEGAAGSKKTLSDVLLIGGNGTLQVGTPTLKGAKIETEILEQGRGDKVVVFKKKKRKGYHKKQGHRQAYTLLKIKKIIV